MDTDDDRITDKADGFWTSDGHGWILDHGWLNYLTFISTFNL